MTKLYSLKVIALGFAMLLTAGSMQAQIYVNSSAGGANNGTTWANAYTDLQSALAAAVSPVEIWVAAGTYYPDEGTGQTNDDRNSTFQLKNGVAIFGGFTGNETLLSVRNWVANETILSGDINQSETLAGNSYTVVTGSGTNSTAKIDGFSITGGNADVLTGSLTAPNRSGGGMHNNAGSPTVISCFFLGNSANSDGGGMFNIISSPTVTNSTFSGNSANNDGGGMFNIISSPAVTNSTFSGNSANNGGGMFNIISSSPTVANCIIWGNSSGIHGVSIVSYSIVQGGLYPGTGNLNADPLFVDQPPVGLGTGGNLRLQPGSPAINAGNNAANSSTTDLDGNPRIQDGNIDMGAFEFMIPPIPTMGEWGLIIMALLMLQGIWLTLVFNPGNVLRNIPALWLRGLHAGLQDKNVLINIAISGLFVFFGIAVFGSPQAADIVGLPLTLLIAVPGVYWYRNASSATLTSVV